MGVINVTPDSFSDGGDCFDPEDAYLKAIRFLDDGADVLDIGAQSTRPKANYLEAEEELKRLLPALYAINKIKSDSKISIDTFHSKVAESALINGANWINDVSGGRNDPNMFSLIAEAKCPYVLTHSRGNSFTMDNLTNYNNLIEDVKNELLRSTERALGKGILSDNIIWDPGLGFAKTNQQCIDLLKNIEVLRREGFPILVGPSRKRFIGSVLNQENPNLRIWGTAAVACRCVSAKIELIRVHDVKEISQTLKMAESIF